MLADLEGLHVGLPDGERALAALEIGQQVLQALQQVLALALDRRLHDLRVGHGEVGGRHRVDELARIEVDLLRGLVVDAFDLLHGVLQPARRQQVGLLEIVEDDLVLPRRVGEALVALGGLGHRLDRLAHHALGGDLPQLHVLLPQLHLRLQQPVGIGQHLGGEVHEGLGEAQRIGRLGAVGLVLLGEVLQQLLAALGDVLEGVLHPLGLGGRQSWNGSWGRLLRHAFPLLDHWLCSVSCDTFSVPVPYLVSIVPGCQHLSR